MVHFRINTPAPAVGLSRVPQKTSKTTLHIIWYHAGRKIGGEMLRWRTFLSQIPFFSPRAEGMVRLVPPRFSCAAPFFAAGEKKCAGPNWP